MMGAGMGALAGGAMGAIGGYFGRKDQKRQQEMALSQLKIPQMQYAQQQLYPQAQGFMQGGFQDLMASLLGGTNAASGNAMNSFNNILAQSGLLGGGMQMGGNAALGLARGQNLNQARGYGANLLSGIENQTMQGVLARALGYGQTVANNPVNQNMFTGAAQGMGMGAQMFQPQQQSGGMGTMDPAMYGGNEFMTPGKQARSQAGFYGPGY